MFVPHFYVFKSCNKPVISFKWIEVCCMFKAAIVKQYKNIVMPNGDQRRRRLFLVFVCRSRIRTIGPKIDPQVLR